MCHALYKLNIKPCMDNIFWRKNPESAMFQLQVIQQTAKTRLSSIHNSMQKNTEKLQNYMDLLLNCNFGVRYKSHL